MYVTEALRLSQHPPPNCRPIAYAEPASWPFRVLGYNRGRYYYRLDACAEILCLAPTQHHALSLLRLAPADFWKCRWPGRRGGFDRLRALNALFRAAESAGLYVPRVQ